MANIRLDLSDKNESTMYLNEDRAPIAVSTNHIPDRYYYLEFEYSNGNRTSFMYDDEDQRNIDLRYVLCQLDELLGVEREKKEF